MQKTILLIAGMLLSGSVFADGQSAPSNQPSTPPSAAATMTAGNIVLQPGQKMPFRLSFVDRKAYDQKRVTHPVPVTVRPDGTFVVPALATLPEGYVLQSTPCIVPQSVTLAGVDILAVHGQGPAPFGAMAWVTNGGLTSLAEMTRAMSEQISALRAGGVKWSTCGSRSSGGAQ